MELDERRQVEEELRVRVEQQAVVAELGQRALAGIDLAALMEEAVERVAETLHVECSKVLELLPDGQALLLRAGVGWRAGLVGQATVSAGLESQAGYTLLSSEPAIVEDLSTETRFSGPPLLRDHGVVSGISVIIQGEGRPFGVMGAHTTSRRTFTQDDIHFLQAIANVLGHAVQRKRDEESLRESQERLLKAQRVARMGFLDWNLRTNEIFLSDQVYRIYGLDPTKPLTTPDLVTQVVHLDDLEYVQENLELAVQGAREYDIDHRIVRPTGEIRWVHAHAELARDDAGNPESLLGTVLDITRRKLAEERQAHFQSLLTAISDVNQLIVRARDPQAMLQEACQVLQRTRGYAGVWIGLLDETGQHLRQVAGAGIVTVVEPVDISLDEPDSPFHCARTALNERRPYLVVDAERSRLCATCSYRARVPHAGTLAVPLLHREQCYGTLAVYTERRWTFDEDETDLLSELANDLVLGFYALKAEEKLRENEEKFRNAFERAAIGRGIAAPEGRFLQANQSFCDIVGYPMDEFLQKRWQDITHPADLEASSRHVGRLMAGEAPSFRFEHRLVHRDGHAVWVDLNVVLVRDLEGNPLYMVGDIVDLTERLQAEAALKEYSERLEEMVEERTQELRDAQEQLVRREKLATLGQLAGGIAHELRNPLGAISNAAYFLNLVLEGPEPAVKETLEILDREVRTSEKIVRSLLDCARTQPPVRQRVNVNTVVQEALSRAGVPANIQVMTHLDGTLPAIHADPDQLAQVFDNLIRNAVQAMPAGGRLVVETSEVTERLPKSETRVAISFTDTGVGIAEENRGKLFEPLFTTKAKGIGLGLVLCKMLVEGHGGTIEVESEVGKGSTFTVKLI